MKHFTLLKFSIVLMCFFALSSFQFQKDQSNWQKIMVQDGITISYVYEVPESGSPVVQLKFENNNASDRIVQWDNQFTFENETVIRKNSTLEAVNKSTVHSGEALIQEIKMTDVSTVLATVRIKDFMVYNLQITK